MCKIAILAGNLTYDIVRTIHVLLSWPFNLTKKDLVCFYIWSNAMPIYVIECAYRYTDKRYSFASS